MGSENVSGTSRSYLCSQKKVETEDILDKKVTDCATSLWQVNMIKTLNLGSEKLQEKKNVKLSA